MSQAILNLHTWVSLVPEVRNRIRKDFNIPCSGDVIVSDGRIETDGTTPEDMKHLTVEKMQKYLTSELDDFNKLFNLVVEKIDNEIKGITNPSVKIDVQEQPQEIKQNKKGNRK